MDSGLGIELDQEVAEIARQNINDWGLQDRVRIEAVSIMDFESSDSFDLITLHNNIYYFPVGDRVELFRKLFGLLKPGGQLLITTGCQGGDPLIPNPPKDTDGRREDSGRGRVRELQGRWPGVLG